MRQRWCLSHRADPVGRAIADRHYNRQKVGADQFVAPGSCLVLLSDDARALWVTGAPFAEFVKHQWAGAWQCSLFRNEGAGVASELITMALAATVAHYGPPPPLGLVTFIDARHVRPTMVRGVPVYGWTWRKVGFAEVGATKGGLLAFQLLPDAFPPAAPARPRSTIGLPLFG